MGADTFSTTAEGKTAQEAFNVATERARYEHGHGGYTGTIAEKRGFVMIEPKAGETPRQCADRLLDEDDRRISDKWGPAGCLKVSEGKFLFFGWASS